jgi:magnesium-transporting ATPase (P-type)
MKADGGNNLRVYLKGAPERVIDRCNKILTSSGIVDMNETLLREVN